MGISNKVLVALAAVLGIGILAKREDVGAGLAGLGTGLSQIGTGLFDVGLAPFKSVGLGLGYAAGGITAFAQALGDIGRGIADLLAPIQGFGGGQGFGGNGAGARNGNETWTTYQLSQSWLSPSAPSAGHYSMYKIRQEDRNGIMYRYAPLGVFNT